MTPNNNLQDRIKYVFVVMLENRAFDHMLGLSHIHGIDAVSGQPTTIDGLNASNDWNLDPHGKKVYASTQRRKTSSSLSHQSFALIGPFEGLGHRLVVIVDEGQDFGLQVLNGEE